MVVRTAPETRLGGTRAPPPIDSRCTARVCQILWSAGA